MIHRIIGQQNTGKTSILSLLLLKDYMRGYTIFSNTALAFPHTLINRDYFLYMAKEGILPNNSSLGLDEFWIWADSKSDMQKANKLSAYVLLQSSKKNVNAYTTGQTDKQDFKRLRENANYLTSCKRGLVKNNKFYEIISPIRNLGEPLNSVLVIQMITKTLDGDRILKLEEKRIKAKKLFKLFNTEKQIFYEGDI